MANGRLTIEIDGKNYPCYQTMRAIMLYEQETGKSALAKSDLLTDQVVFLWASCKGACLREKIEFPYTVEDFADNITPEDLMAWAQAQAEEQTENGEEKKTQV